jgi:hypothetical protein
VFEFHKNITSNKKMEQHILEQHILEKAKREIESPTFNDGDRVEIIPKSWVYGDTRDPINCLHLKGSFGDELSRKNTSDFAVVYKHTADKLFKYFGEVRGNMRFARWFRKDGVNLFPCRIDLYTFDKQFRTLSKLAYFYIFADKSITTVFKEIRRVMRKEFHSILVNTNDNIDIVRRNMESKKGFVHIHEHYRSEIPFDTEFYLPTKECIEIVVLTSEEMYESVDKSICSIHDEPIDFVCATCDKRHPMCLKCFVESHETATEKHEVLDLKLYRKELSAKSAILQNLAKDTESFSNESVIDNVEKIRTSVATLSSMQTSIYKPRVTTRVHTECKHCTGISIMHICEQCPSDTVMCCDCARDHEKKRGHVLHRFSEPTDICYKHFKCLDYIQGKDALCEDCVLNDWIHDENRPLLTMARMRFLQREAVVNAERRFIIESAINKYKLKQVESSFYTRCTSTFSEKIMVPAVTVRFKPKGHQFGSRAICVVGELVFVAGMYGEYSCIDSYHITTGEFHRKYGHELCKYRIASICSGMHRNKRVLFLAERNVQFVRIFDTEDNRQIDAITGVEDPCAVCLYGTLLFVIDSKMCCVRIFNTETKGLIRTLKSETMDSPYAMCMDDELLFVSDIQRVHVFNFITGEYIRCIGEPSITAITGIYLHERTLYVSYRDWINMYDADTGDFISITTPITPNLFNFVLVHTPDNKKYFLLSSAGTALETKSADI